MKILFAFLSFIVMAVSSHGAGVPLYSVPTSAGPVSNQFLLVVQYDGTNIVKVRFDSFTSSNSFWVATNILWTQLALEETIRSSNDTVLTTAIQSNSDTNALLYAGGVWTTGQIYLLQIRLDSLESITAVLTNAFAVTNTSPLPALIARQEGTNETVAEFYGPSGMPVAAKIGTNGTVTATAFAGFGIMPIGSVTAWITNSFTNTPALPDGWVKCEGQTLSDPASIFDGQTIPDLNGGNRFLSGATTSGGTGGSATHVHANAWAANDASNKALFLSVGGDAYALIPYTSPEYPTDSASSLPPYYDVVWIMRVK